MGDVQTETPNQIADRMLEAAAPFIRQPLERALEEAEDRFVFCDNCERPSREEDLETIWGKDAESGELVDARICRVCRLEAERKEIAQQERQRVRGALKAELIGLHNGTAPDRDERYQMAWRDGVAAAQAAALDTLEEDS
jgi:hypothetical protein